MLLQGRAHILGNDVNTDDIIASKYKSSTTDMLEMAKHLMGNVDPDFVRRLRPGDLIVAGANFGCGSSRETAPLVIKAAGISAVLAKGFARIFFRNAINIGLPIVECPGIQASVKQGDRVAVDLTAGVVVLASGERLAVPPFPPFMEGIVREGGWMPYLLKQHPVR